jgi:hypothetical protein
VVPSSNDEIHLIIEQIIDINDDLRCTMIGELKIEMYHIGWELNSLP